MEAKSRVQAKLAQGIEMIDQVEATQTSLITPSSSKLPPETNTSPYSPMTHTPANTRASYYKKHNGSIWKAQVRSCQEEYLYHG
jgi:hypothetical protein